MAMEKKLKVGVSPTLFVMWMLIFAMVAGFCATTYLGLVDLRTEEQIREEEREKLINHDLFDDAMIFAEDIVKEGKQRMIISISCVKVRISGGIQKGVIVKWKGQDGEHCYLISSLTNKYRAVSYNTYNSVINDGRIISELIIQGEDLSILFEEVSK
jgi:hypothetical protein